MTTHVNDDLRINGRDEKLTSSIITPQGFITELQGTLNVIDRLPITSSNDNADITVKGNNIFSSRTLREEPSGNLTITQSDDIVVSSDTNFVVMTLPAISQVHPKTYTLKFEKEGKIETTGSDTIDGNNFWLVDKGASVTLTSNGTNKWHVISSHNISGHYQNVKISADSNQNFLNLVAGYTLNGYVLQENDRILLNKQTNKIQNGIFVIRTGITPLRGQDMNGSFFHGSVYSTENKKEFRVLNDGITDTDDIEIIQIDSHEEANVTQTTSDSAPVTANGDYGVITTVSLTNGSGVSNLFLLFNSNYNPTTDIMKVSVKNYTGAGIPVVGLLDTTGSGQAWIQVTNIGTQTMNAPLEIFYEIFHTN